jgi:hypothetical protein
MQALRAPGGCAAAAAARRAARSSTPAPPHAAALPLRALRASATLRTTPAPLPAPPLRGICTPLRQREPWRAARRGAAVAATRAAGDGKPAKSAYNGVFLLILVNVLLFAAVRLLRGLLALRSRAHAHALRTQDHLLHLPWVSQLLYLHHRSPHWWQFITSAFCHGGSCGSFLTHGATRTHACVCRLGPPVGQPLLPPVRCLRSLAADAVCARTLTRTVPSARTAASSARAWRRRRAHLACG